jgi:hypothetical protein
MYLLPYFRLVIHTTLTVEQAVDLLKRHVHRRPVLALTWQVSSWEFEGFFYGRGGFRLNRLLRYYRSSFTPVMYGRIEDSDGGSRVRLFASFHPMVLTLLAAMLLGWWSQSQPLLVEAAASGRLLRATAVGLGVAALIYGCLTALFWVEAIRLRRFVVGLFAPHLRRPTSACSGARAARSLLDP